MKFFKISSILSLKLFTSFLNYAFVGVALPPTRTPEVYFSLLLKILLVDFI